MCIAILKPKGKRISKETLETCCKNNPDGMGFAYIKRGRVIIQKYMDFDKFYKDYIKVEKKSPMLIHFRIATHGKVELKNCHPFKLNNRMALIHNGVISGYGDKQNKTDTKDFIDKVIGHIQHNMWDNPYYRTLVGKAIGYSKFAILDVSGKYFIINEDLGTWDNGIWYSNNSYKPKEVKQSCYTNWVWDNKLGWVERDKSKTKTYYDSDEYEYDYSHQLSWFNKMYDKQKELDEKDDVAEVVPEQDTEPEILTIYKCNDCGRVFKIDSCIDDVQCEVCKSSNVSDIGIRYDNVDYYYDETGELSEVK